MCVYVPCPCLHVLPCTYMCALMTGTTWAHLCPHLLGLGPCWELLHSWGPWVAASLKCPRTCQGPGSASMHLAPPGSLILSPPWSESGGPSRPCQAHTTSQVLPWVPPALSPEVRSLSEAPDGLERTAVQGGGPRMGTHRDKASHEHGLPAWPSCQPLQLGTRACHPKPLVVTQPQAGEDAPPT